MASFDFEGDGAVESIDIPVITLDDYAAENDIVTQLGNQRSQSAENKTVAHALRKGPDGFWYLIAGNGPKEMYSLQNVPSPVIPNPRVQRVLEADDRLLCFGKLEAMRDLVPERRRRRARPKIQPLPENPIPEPDQPSAVEHEAT